MSVPVAGLDPDRGVAGRFEYARSMAPGEPPDRDDPFEGLQLDEAFIQGATVNELPADVRLERLRRIDEQLPTGITAQLDFSATPRYPKGGLFTWTVYDYPKFQVVLRCNQNNRYEDQQFAFYGKNGTMFIRGAGAPQALGAGGSLSFVPEPPYETPEGYSTGSWPEAKKEEYLARWEREHPGPAVGQG